MGDFVVLKQFIRVEGMANKCMLNPRRFESCSSPLF